MKRQQIIYILLAFSIVAHSQDSDSLQDLHIKLKYQRTLHQKQLDSIDQKILDIERQIHELRILSAQDGFPGKAYSDLQLFDTPLLFGKRETLTDIPKNTRLLVTKEINGFYKTEYNGVDGYVRSYGVTLDNINDKELLQEQAMEISDAKLKAEQEEKAQKEREQAQKKVQEIKSKYKSKTAQRILDKEVWLGMTEEMLYYSRGYPNETKRLSGTWGVHKTCIYGEFPNCTYYFIENGKLTSIGD